jgi:hypothetical protein
MLLWPDLPNMVLIALLLLLIRLLLVSWCRKPLIESRIPSLCSSVASFAIAVAPSVVDAFSEIPFITAGKIADTALAIPAFAFSQRRCCFVNQVMVKVAFSYIQQIKC